MQCVQKLFEYNVQKCTNIFLSFPANIPTQKRESTLTKEIHGLKMSPSFQEE